MTVCYPLTVQLDYTELKYSLRSIEQFLTPPFEVVIVGDLLPFWINNVTQIELANSKGLNNYSVRRKVIAALRYAEEIFFMNDDFYLLEKTDPLSFPFFSSGMLASKGESGAKTLVKYLDHFKKPTKYYGHYPALYKRDFLQALEQIPDECPTKSAYLNYREVESVEIPDCKLLNSQKVGYIKEFIKGKPSFSTGMYSIKSALPVLEELFPMTSKYEI